MPNIDIGSRIKPGYFRRLAIGAWRSPTDPKVYTKLKCDITHLNDFFSVKSDPPVTYIHFFTKVMGLVFQRFPDLNQVLIRNRLYQRKAVTAFIHTHLRMDHGYDLLGVTINDVDRRSLIDIAEDVDTQVKQLRKGGIKPMENAKRIIMTVPSYLYQVMVSVLDFFMYTLNIDFSFAGLPKDSYGSFAVTAVGSFGFEEVYVPLFPFSRLPLIMAVGKPVKEWVYDGQQANLKTYITLTFTMDHRYFDGAHIAKPMRLFKKIVADPEQYGIKT